MKKNVSLKLTSAALLLAPLMITGCQTPQEYFGGPTYRNPAPYDQARVYPAPAVKNHAAPMQKRATVVQRRTTTTTTTTVPVRQPTMRGAPAAPVMSPSAVDAPVVKKTTTNNTAVMVPVAPPASPKASPAGIVPPTVGQ